MKKYILTSVVFSLIIFSCTQQKQEETTTASAQPNKEIYLEQVKKYEDQLRSATLLNDTLGQAAIKAYADYASLFDDSLSPEFLFRAAEVSVGIKAYEKALIYYENLLKKYPNYKHQEEALYLQGFLYDNFLNQDDKAKKVYENVISKYPEHKLAEDSKAAIKNLGKTDEELIKEFEAKNK